MMKIIILSLIGLIGLMDNATAQETMQFTYIGNTGGNHESVVITTEKDLKMNDVEILPLDRRTLDSIKSYILRYYTKKRATIVPIKNGTTNSLNPLSVIKVIGVDSIPLYFKKNAYSELVSSAMQYLRTVDLNPVTENFVLRRLEYVGYKRFFYRDFVDSPAHANPYFGLKHDSNK